MYEFNVSFHLIKNLLIIFINAFYNLQSNKSIKFNQEFII